MIVPLEALFYLDVAKRAIDEMLAIGEERGMIDKGVLPKSEYLPPETLDMFLVTLLPRHNLFPHLISKPQLQTSSVRTPHTHLPSARPLHASLLRLYQTLPIHIIPLPFPPPPVNSFRMPHRDVVMSSLQRDGEVPPCGEEGCE